jgi:hypothetical protein
MRSHALHRPRCTGEVLRNSPRATALVAAKRLKGAPPHAAPEVARWIGPAHGGVVATSHPSRQRPTPPGATGDAMSATSRAVRWEGRRTKVRTGPHSSLNVPRAAPSLTALREKSSSSNVRDGHGGRRGRDVQQGIFHPSPNYPLLNRGTASPTRRRTCEMPLVARRCGAHASGWRVL